MKWSFTQQNLALKERKYAYFTDASVWVNNIKLSLIEPFNVFKHSSVDVIYVVYMSLNKILKKLQIWVYRVSTASLHDADLIKPL